MVHNTETEVQLLTMYLHTQSFHHRCLLPARASEQGNVIGLVSVYIYIYMSSKKNCN